jgi:peptide/nickel transport system substrate-binding protein
VGGIGALHTLHPLLAETEAERTLAPLLFDSLLDYDPESGRLTPGLARAWSVSDQSRTITFTLRADARWHDGEPVTAADVAFSLGAARDPAIGSLYGPQLQYVAEVTALDDRTVVVDLDEPECPSLAVLGEVPIIPRHALPDSPTAASFGEAPVGSGPFVFVEWAAGGELRLAANPDYWGGRPYLDAWSYRPYEDAAGLRRALEEGEVDAALLPPGRLPGGDAAASRFRMYAYPAPEFLFVAFNNEHPLLGDRQARLALSMAVDREALLEEALGGAGELIAASLPAGHWAADARLEPPPYDPEAARRLLRQAGWSDTDGDGWLDRDGERLRLPVRTNAGNRLREDVASLVAGYYRALGIDARLEIVLWGAVVDDLFTHDFEVIVFGWPIAAEPDQRRWWLSTEDEIGWGYNFVSFADAEVDRLLAEAASVPGCDPDQRAQLYGQIQGWLAEERPYDFLLVPYAALLARPGLEGVRAGPYAGPAESADAWHLLPQAESEGETR